MSISHAAVKNARLTCEACPEQYEGQLTDGRYFYFRYRHGMASLAVASTPTQVAGRIDETLDLKPGPMEPDGMFTSQEQRDNTFTTLLARFQ